LLVRGWEDDRVRGVVGLSGPNAKEIRRRLAPGVKQPAPIVQANVLGPDDLRQRLPFSLAHPSSRQSDVLGRYRRHRPSQPEGTAQQLESLRRQRPRLGGITPS
jgi:hypothetical protein